MNIFKKTCTSCLGCMKKLGEGVVDTCIDNTFCKKCVSDKYRIKHVLKSIFRFKNIEVNEGQWFDFSDEYLHKFHKHSNIKVAIENADFYNLENTLNLFNSIYKYKYMEYWIKYFGLTYDNSRQRDFFPLNEKISLTSVDDIVDLIYNAEKTFGEKILKFYKGQAMDEMEILRWEMEQKVKVSKIIGDTVLSNQKTDIDINNYSFDIQSLWIDFLKYHEHNPEDVTNTLDFIHKYNVHYIDLGSDDGYYHEGHESGQHPAFTGKETADKEIVRQGINEPSIASDIYAPGGMEQLRLRTRAVPKVKNMNRGGKRRKKTRRKKIKLKKRTRKKKGGSVSKCQEYHTKFKQYNEDHWNSSDYLSKTIKERKEADLDCRSITNTNSKCDIYTGECFYPKSDPPNMTTTDTTTDTTTVPTTLPGQLTPGRLQRRERANDLNNTTLEEDDGFGNQMPRNGYYWDLINNLSSDYDSDDSFEGGKRRKKTRRKNKKKRKKTRRKRGSGRGNKINNKKKIKKKNKIHKTKKKGNRFNRFLTRKLSPNYLKHTISSLNKRT